MSLKSLLSAATAVVVLALAPLSHAGFISGGVTVDGTFSKLPDVGSSSIVSNLGFINVDHSATIELGTATGWFASLGADAAAPANHINLDPFPPTQFTFN